MIRWARPERALSDLEPARARYLACFAYILSRVARADHEVADAESHLLAQIVAERGGLPIEQAALVVRIAATEGLRHGGTEDFIVTREFAGIADRGRSWRSSIVSSQCPRWIERFTPSKTTRSGRLSAS